MKYIYRAFIFLITLIIQSTLLYAGSIDYNSNQSAKYFMNPAKTASTEGADIVAYNPAGTALMKPGLYFDVSEQFLMRNYEQDVSDNTLSKRTYKTDEPAYIYPNLFMVYNFGKTGPGKLAVFASAGVIGGGGTVKWNGTAGYDEMALYLDTLSAFSLTSIKNNVKASSLYLGFGAGASYSFFKDLISLSIGGRFVHSERDFKIDGELQFTGGTQYYNASWDFSADGGAPIFGLDIKPYKKLTIGLRYEMSTKLEFEYDQDENNASNNFAEPAVSNAAITMFNVDGVKRKYNLPDIFSLGAEYAVTNKLAVSAAGTIYNLSKADMDKFEEFCNTGWDISAGGTYKITKNLKAGTGFTYTDIGVKDSLKENLQQLKRYSLNPNMNSLMYGLGITCTIWKDFDVTLSGAYTHFFPENDKSISTAYGASLDINYRKSIYSTALGVSYKL